MLPRMNLVVMTVIAVVMSGAVPRGAVAVPASGEHGQRQGVVLGSVAAAATDQPSEPVELTGRPEWDLEPDRSPQSRLGPENNAETSAETEVSEISAPGLSVASDSDEDSVDLNSDGQTINLMRFELTFDDVDLMRRPGYMAPVRSRYPTSGPRGLGMFVMPLRPEPLAFNQHTILIGTFPADILWQIEAPRQSYSAAPVQVSLHMTPDFD